MAAVIRPMIGSGPGVVIELSRDGSLGAGGRVGSLPEPSAGPATGSRAVSWAGVGGGDFTTLSFASASMTPRLPFADASLSTVIVSFVGVSPPAEKRERLLAEIRRVLGVRGRLFIVDHNRPRQRLAALRALAAVPAPRGRSPRARWRRLAYPTARTAQAAGLAVTSLRLANAERVQIVVARKESVPWASGATGEAEWTSP